jgi:hypothetical protein
MSVCSILYSYTFMLTLTAHTVALSLRDFASIRIKR